MLREDEHGESPFGRGDTVSDFYKENEFSILRSRVRDSLATWCRDQDVFSVTQLTWVSNVKDLQAVSQPLCDTTHGTSTV